MLRVYCMDHKAGWVKMLPLVKFVYNNSYQTTIQITSYEILYDKSCCFPLSQDELGERDSLVQSLGLELTQRMIKYVQLIRQRMRHAQDRQKSYADQICLDLEFSVDDRVFIKVSPYEHIMRFGRNCKLTLRYIDSNEIIEQINRIAYRVALLGSIDRIHNMFHILLLNKYIRNPLHVLKT